MNKKGFTMVELLAVIVILGILGTIGVTATTRYLTQSREKSYRILSQTIYEAYENCAIQGKCSLPVLKENPDGSLQSASLEPYNIEYLLKDGYLENLSNPNTSQGDCTGTVTVRAVNKSSSGYVKYQYEVNLDCPGMAKKNYIWPDAKKDEDKNKQEEK